MILNASQRTDLAAYYSDWFLRRLREHGLRRQNPLTARPGAWLDLNPDRIEAIVFWTKNPYPLLDRLKQVTGLGYQPFFQFTLNAYERDLEPGLPDKLKLLDILRTLSLRVGPQSIVWRYGPVVLDQYHHLNWHLERFSELAQVLQPHCHACALDFYPLQASGPLSRAPFIQAAAAAGLEVWPEQAAPAAAKLLAWLEQGLDRPVRDARQLDIGLFNTCPCNCVWCANVGDSRRLRSRLRKHDPSSLLLCGGLPGCAQDRPQNRQLHLPELVK